MRRKELNDEHDIKGIFLRRKEKIDEIVFSEDFEGKVDGNSEKSEKSDFNTIDNKYFADGGTTRMHCGSDDNIIYSTWPSGEECESSRPKIMRPIKDTNKIQNRRRNTAA